MSRLTINTEALAALAQDSPVTMINLLRYRDEADFGERSDAPCSGMEAYQRYATQAIALVESMGASVRFLGAAAASVSAPANEIWDDIVIVDYPSVACFISMAQSEAYQSFCYLRLAALADTRLIACQGNARFAASAD